MSIRALVFESLEKRKSLNARSIVVQSLLGLLIIASTVTSICETVPDIDITTRNFLERFQLLCGPIFLIEYVLRLWVSPLHTPGKSKLESRLRFALRPTMMIDFLVILPFIIPHFIGLDVTSLRMLRLVRIMGLARLGWFSRSLNSMVGIIRKSALELFVSIMFSLLLLVIAATGIYHFERESQPEVFQSIPKSIWWATNALTGIWLGDVYPVTLGGKIFAALIALLGVGIVALPAGIIASGIIDSVNAHKIAETELCPHCKNVLHGKKDAA